MTHFNSILISNKNKNVRKGLKFKNIACLLFISIFLISSFFFNNFNLNSNSKSYNNDLEIDELKNYNSPEISTDPQIFQNPYTVNFTEMQDFFSNNFKSKLNYDIPLYVSKSNSGGVIVDNTTYSKDNLLLYKSLFKEDYNSIEAYNAYEALTKTPLWYQGNETQFEYGFVSSINGTTGAIKDNRRNLVDNLMSIFLLLGNQLSSPAINSEIYKTFNLINSTHFYNKNDQGFLEYNDTSSGTIYYTKSNFYAILAMFLIHEYSTLDGTTKLKIYNLANNIMNVLVNKMWDKSNLGFYYSAESDWGKPGEANQYKYLDTNALGIIALVDTWIKNGMVANSVYLKNATALYNQMSKPSLRGGESGLWNISKQAYENYRLTNWGPKTNLDSMKIDLESNALMMLACLKLFEATGNFTYYNRSITIFETLRNEFYLSSINAHRTSIGAVNDSDVKLYPNLVLCDAYLKAKEIYKNTTLTAYFNISNKVNFIMNQEFINLTCIYAFEKQISYFKPGDKYYQNKIRCDNITKASINYIFKYPNGTNIVEIQNTFKTNKTTLIYPINNSLPIENGYKIVIYANWTYFGFANTSEYFNVISGLRVQDIIGLGDDVYQGQTKNITINVYSYYNYSLTLNVTLNGAGIEPEFKENVIFKNNNKTSVCFNITIKNSATPDDFSKIYFTFENGTVLYLEYECSIYILNALSYSNLMYNKKVVPGKDVKVFLELINFLSNETQELNLIFSGTYISLINQSITLQEKERRIMSISVFTLPVISESSIQVDMTISKENKIFYEEELIVSIVSKLEIKNINFPEKVKQGISFLGADSYLIVVIENNLESSEEFTLFIDGEKTYSNLKELVPGKNRIEVKLSPAWNPYEFGIKTVTIEIEDSSEDVIYEKIIEYEIELSALNLIIFYMLPILFLIGIVLYYKNKEIKNKLLRR